jgi:hypothetical protein
MPLVDHLTSQPSLDISPITAAEVRKLQLRPSVDYVRKLCVYVGTIQRIFLLSDDFYSDSTLILTTIAVKWCMDVGARPHVCGVF